MSHSDMTGMDEAAMVPMQQCDDCAPLPDEGTPCTHTNVAGACSSMISCLTAAAEVAAPFASAPPVAMRLFSGTIVAPDSTTRAPEPPPPRA